MRFDRGMDQPLLSVVTPVLNGATTIRDTLASVATAGDYFSCEHLVLDGESGDGTVEIVRSFDNPRLRFWSAADSGLYHAINRGIARARGRWISVLNSDDFFEVGQLPNLGKLLELAEERGFDYLCGPVRRIPLSGNEDEYLLPRPRSRRRQVASSPFAHPGLFLRREIHRKVGLYREDLRIAADTALMFELLDRGYRGRDYGSAFVTMREGGLSYQRYHEASSELRDIHKRRLCRGCWHSLWNLYRSERMRSHPDAGSGSWFAYWSWAARDFFGMND